MSVVSSRVSRVSSIQLQKQHIERQRFQQNNTQQQHSNTLQYGQSPLNNPTRRFINSVQQRTQPISVSPQETQKPSMATSVLSSAEHNTHVTSIKIEVDTPECVEEKEQTQQSSSPRLEPENSSSESFAYLQKTINDPTNAIVQHQIQGNTAKMLVMLTTGEQRLFTFDIPNEDCTVHDLLDHVRVILDQLNISFSGETQVSLVDDPTLGINYIVEAGVMHTSSLNGRDGDCNSTQEIVSAIANVEKLPQNINTSNENSNTSSQIPEKQHIKKQRFQQKNTQQQQSNTLQHGQSPLNNPTRRFINSVQQRTQPILVSPQEIQKPFMATSAPLSAKYNTHVTSVKMEVNTPECVEEKEQMQQSSSPRLEPENSSSESFAYLQKPINDPTNAIVQHQIQGNTAKMLVMLTTGEQRLITFDIPNEDCTVHDLLDQVRAVLGQLNISFPGETQVSLVDDPALGINYIVEAGVMHTSSLNGSDGDCNSTQEIVSTTANAEKLSQNINTLDENSNTSPQTPEEPILVKGMLALCPHCGYSSLHFNRCERCNTKLKIEEVKSVPIAERKETGMSVDMFYKKNNSEQNVVKLKKNRTRRSYMQMAQRRG